MNKHLRLFATLALIALVGVVAVLPAFAQTTATATDEVNPNAQITFPPPVYLLSGAFEIRGTVNLPNAARYLLEYRALNDDLTPIEDGDWLPATLPATDPVDDDVLGVWDTTITEDGVYELRLTVILTGDDRIESLVSPLRVENEPPPFVTIIAPAATQQPAIVTNTPGAQVTASTGAGTGSPQGTARTNGNVRASDTTAAPIITSLRAGTVVPVIGISNSGTGWYLIQLADARQGWVAPSVLTVTGDTSILPRINPPVIATVTAGSPAPSRTATINPTAAAGLPDAVIANVRYDREIRQGEAFQMFVTVQNQSAAALPPVVVGCNFTPMNALFSSTSPQIPAFSQFDVAITAQLDSGGGANVIANCAVDVNNLVVESNETNNFFNLTTLLLAP